MKNIAHVNLVMFINQENASMKEIIAETKKSGFTINAMNAKKINILQLIMMIPNV